MFTLTLAGSDISDHDSFTISDEGVFEDKSQLGPSERSVVFALIESSDALFESKEGFVDFSTIDFGLFILVSYISTSFASGQIDEGKFTVDIIALSEYNLQDCM